MEVGRVIGLLSIPLAGLAIWAIIRQVRRTQTIRAWTPVVGLVMAPITLMVNLLILRQAFPGWLGPSLLVVGLGFGLAWGQSNRLELRGEQVVGRRSWLHLVFWGVSYAVTMVLAAFVSARWVGGGLIAMFFATGTGFGSSLNLLIRHRQAQRLLSR